MTKTNLPQVITGTSGRPTYSDAVKRKLLLGLQGGYTRRAASGFAGIHHSTFYEWIANDPEFKQEVETAENVAEARYTATVRRAAQGDRQDVNAALKWLERRRPAEWRERMSIDDKAQTAEEELDGRLQSDELDRRIQEIAEDALRRGTDRAVGHAEGDQGEAGSGSEPS